MGPVAFRIASFLLFAFMLFWAYVAVPGLMDWLRPPFGQHGAFLILAAAILVWTLIADRLERGPRR